MAEPKPDDLPPIFYQSDPRLPPPPPSRPPSSRQPAPQPPRQPPPAPTWQPPPPWQPPPGAPRPPSNRQPPPSPYPPLPAVTAPPTPPAAVPPAPAPATERGGGAPGPAAEPVARSRRGKSDRQEGASGRRRLARGDAPPRGKGRLVGGLALTALLAAAGAVIAVASREAPFVPKSVDELTRHVEALEREGRYIEAIAALERCPPGIRAQATPRFLQQKVDVLLRYRAFQEDLEGALASGDSQRLRDLVIKLERFEVAPELRELPIVAPWKERARALLGAQVYADLAVFGDDLKDTPAPKATEPAPPPRATEPRAAVIERLEDPERRARLDAATARGAERLAECRRRMASREAAAAKRTAAELARALKDERPLSVPAEGGRPAAQGRLKEYGPRRFSVEVGPQDVRRFTWADAPAALACDVLERALDPDDAQDRLRLALTAIRGTLFDRARAHLERARALDPELALPDLDALLPLARVLHGTGTIEDARVALEYPFDHDDELRDLRGLTFTQVRREGGALTISSGLAGLLGLEELEGLEGVEGLDLGSTSTALASFAGRWRGPLELELELVPLKGELLVGLGAVAVVVGPRGAGWGPWKELGKVICKGALDPARPLLLGAWRVSDGEARVIVKQGATSLLEVVAPATWPLELTLGARGGPVRLKTLRVRGAPDAAWLEEERERVPFRLEVELDRWRAAATAKAAGPEGALSPELDVTSAEDEASLANVPQEARQLVEEARRWLRVGLRSRAEDLLRRAISEGRGQYWAAEYLLAQLEVEGRRDHASSLEGPRIRLDQAIAAIDGFYEALAARSGVHLQEGRLDEARRDADAALALKPDHAPAHLARAYVALQQGDVDGALAEARLAAELVQAPGWDDHAARFEAIRDGPPWNDPVTREDLNYRLTTDMPDRADAFLRTLGETRALAPRVFPVLRQRPGSAARMGRVLLFSRAEDYYRYAYRTTGDRKEETAGFFSPLTGTLHIFESKDGGEETLRVLRHEATHQWVHSLGLELPYWLNEALADYLGGYDPVRQKSAPDPKEVRALIEGQKRLKPLFDLMTMSPSQFYSGNAYLNYAQAWSFVHCCMEGGDPRLKRALFDYLQQHGQGRAGDRSRQAGVELDHLYAATFHQLDMARVQQAWWAHVERMAREVGVSSQ